MLLELGFNSTLVISSATMAKEILKTHDLDFCTRPNSLGPKRLSYNYLDIAFARYGDHWTTMRKLFISKILTTKRAKLFQQARDVEINSLSRSTLVDLDEMLSGVMDEIICVVAFGKSFKERRFNGKKLNEVIDEAMMMLDSFSSGDFFP